MFVRGKKNKSGSISIQIVSKARGHYKVIRTVGCATTQHEIEKLTRDAKQLIVELKRQPSLFGYEQDELVDEAFALLSNSSIRTVGPELVFGQIFDFIGYNQIQEDLFRHLVVSRLAYPLSKLKTIDYLYRFQGVTIDINSVYRFLDRLSSELKDQVEQIAFSRTKELLGGQISIVFYDMTTLYFEASDEDDLRRTGFSKDGKHQNPQIYIGLLVGMNGYAIGYDVFEGNVYEGHTLIPFLENMAGKFNLGMPVVVADAGLLSNDNVKALEAKGYEYIIGARLKNESDETKAQVMGSKLADGQTCCIDRNGKNRLIVSYSHSRSQKDASNRKRGLDRLEKLIKKGKLTKANINNRGYNKYLRLEGEVLIEIDYQKFELDAIWDGLKGYVTNAKMPDAEVIDSYKNLWHIEKAFRMSKTDLRIRPIYHRLRDRIEAHICISFVAYSVYKELERALIAAKSTISLKRAAELTHNMYQVCYTLPASKQLKNKLLAMDEAQKELYDLIQTKFRVSH